jgi:glycosyltransferase involved in cell wall biosynthesis
MPPGKIVVVASESGDIEECIRDNPKVTLLFDRGSLTHKRNLALPYVEEKYVFFADDDIEFHHAYLSEAVLLLEDFPGIVGLSGKVLKDGRVTREEAKDLIRTTPELRHWKGRFPVSGRFKQLYGCNMVLRRSVLERETFDEELPGYSFGEDYDFWVRVRRYGVTGIYDRCLAVHLQAAGEVSACQSGVFASRQPLAFLSKGISHLPWPWSLVRIGFMCVKFPLRSLGALMRGETSSPARNSAAIARDRRYFEALATFAFKV